MKIDKHPLDDHQMQLTVEVEAERMEASKRRAARQIAVITSYSIHYTKLYDQD